jgi:chromosomal replication initiation ATPase DnaA
VGRQRELALLARVLDGADERGWAAPLLVLAGEPGIGKTRLLQAVAQQAAPWRRSSTSWTPAVGGTPSHPRWAMG